MPINKETIISVYEEKLTLMQWLKTINKALDEAVLTGVEVRQKGNATFSFVVTFEDGTELESNEFVLAQGESINGATIRNGHLYLSLTNGDELDAGNLKPVTSFAINASQHLIVNYGDGTNQDLGAIFSGNVNIDGNLTADSIIENMSGYSFTKYAGFDTYGTSEAVYAGAVKTGNKLTLVYAYKFTPNENATGSAYTGRFMIPSAIMAKIYPAFSSIVDSRTVDAVISNYSRTQVICYVIRQDTVSLYFGINEMQNLTQGQTYYIRHEITLLLSDNMAE